MISKVLVGILVLAGGLPTAPLSAGDSPPGHVTTADRESSSEELVSIDPLALTSEMKEFVERRVGRGQSRNSRLLRLQEAIFDAEDGLGVEYGSASTHTAAGTFRERSGNCLSFTLLFIALARHLGLTTYFVEVDEVTGWSQRGEVGLSHWHMYAEVELESQVVPVDFLPWTERRYRSSRRISEERARSHYHNNVGADLLTAGDAPAALRQFQAALELDPTFHPARINMAVAYRRNAQPAEAEGLLLGVLEVEPGNAVAAANLATLYLDQGRQNEAERWLARREAFLSRNPFYHFRLGLRAFDEGAFERAREHFKRAISRQRDEAVFYERLAETQFELGRVRKGRQSLRRALHFTDNPERRRVIENRLRDRRSGRARGF